MSTRRHALKLMLGTAAASAFVSHADADEAIALRPGSEAPVHIPEDFIGLGYEMSSVARPGLLSKDNEACAALVSGLGARGMLRVGGIVADYTRFDPQGESNFDPKNTVITQENLYRFAGFLKRTGWRAIWSLNFAQGSLQDAVTEASAVAAVLGPHLAAFELGNEVENYGNGAHPFRPARNGAVWNYAAWLSQFRQWSSAIRKAVPGAAFAAPDTASSVEWVESMAQDASDDVQLLTTHYYRDYQSRGSADQLLSSDPKLQDALTRLRAASVHSRIPWRMCEANSFSGGGLPGVSDTLIGALWTLDFMLLLAKNGCAGVNMETGYNQLGFLSSYSPIRNDAQDSVTAGPAYYGMLAFAEARRHGSQMLSVQAGLDGLNLTLYTLGESGRSRCVVIVNRERSRDVVVDVRGVQKENAVVYRLISQDGQILFGGVQVTDKGRWLPGLKEKAHSGIVKVPALSAAIVTTSRES